ncbi:MAG TPA: gliding motility-associated C-terminal domain-containing protein, partial [Bacteroidales bacterium]|nr:gliding motility-associated C-terminal domain-containing protein [Bacteroidales bacterium]
SSVSDLCENEAAITLSASTSGGTWSGNGVTADQFDPSSAGSGNHIISYSVTNGACSDNDTETIHVDAMPDASIDAIGPFCIGDAAVTLTAATAEGTWIGTGVSGDAFNPNTAGVGTHSISHEVSNGACTNTASQTVTVLGAPEINITEVVNPLCHGDSNGSISVSSPDVEEQNFAWSNNVNSSNNTNLSADEYTVTVTDNNGCTNQASYSLTDPQPISISNSNIQNPGCNNAENGEIHIEPIGGTGNLTCSWSNGDSGTNISNLASGNYVVTITDENGCTENSQYILPDAPGIVLSIDKSDISCFGDKNGEISLTAQQGTPPFSYQISNQNTQINSNSAQNLSQGNYAIHIEDDAGCAVDTMLSIAEPSELIMNAAITNPSCIGNNDGQILISANGGTPPYDCLADGFHSEGFEFSNMTEGDYTVILSDANGCRVSQDISLVDNDVLCIRIPNAFTPNADGNNDEWLIENIDLFPNAIIQVFNRWGQKLYSGSPSSDPWDGTFNGKNLPVGPYVYTILLNDHAGQHFSGIVTIVY